MSDKDGVLSRAIDESATAILETYAHITDGIPAATVRRVLWENMQQVDNDLDFYRDQTRHVPLDNVNGLADCPFCGSPGELRLGTEIPKTLEDMVKAEKNAICSASGCPARYIICSKSEWNTRDPRPAIDLQAVADYLVDAAGMGKSIFWGRLWRTIANAIRAGIGGGE